MSSTTGKPPESHERIRRPPEGRDVTQTAIVSLMTVLGVERVAAAYALLPAAAFVDRPKSPVRAVVEPSAPPTEM